MERHFERELGHLRETLIAMGYLVERQLSDASEALFRDRPDLARTVIAGDKDVDALDTLIEGLCQSIFALNQPVAIDLRLLMSALGINNQLERIGDIAVNLAERVEAVAPFRDLLRRTKLEEMAEIARIMVGDALRSFITGDPVLAQRVLDSDDVVDKLNVIIFRDLVDEMQEDHTMIEPGAHLLILSRHLERLADHATNIAEDVIFLVEARIVKHHARV